MPEKTGTNDTSPQGLHDAETDVVGVYLPEQEVLECRRCYETATQNGRSPRGEPISESELTTGDGWVCGSCRTDLRTCARIDRLEIGLRIADATIAAQGDELRKMREHLRDL